jgi:hypothetical protein
VAHWTGLDTETACATETEILRMWRSQGWPKVPGVPHDGHTETTHMSHIGATVEHLIGLLGSPSPMAQAVRPRQGLLV